MLHYVTGDLLQSNAEALLNAVNTVGVMGKGIALLFKKEYPNNYKIYVAACKSKELHPGKLLMVRDNSLHHGPKTIINFPTKVHWRSPSRYEYVDDGLISLKALIESENIQSIALPPLGCGNGGLDWTIVKGMIEKHLGNLSIDIMVYAPSSVL